MLVACKLEPALFFFKLEDAFHFELVLQQSPVHLCNANPFYESFTLACRCESCSSCWFWEVNKASFPPRHFQLNRWDFQDNEWMPWTWLTAFSRANTCRVREQWVSRVNPVGLAKRLKKEQSRHLLLNLIGGKEDISLASNFLKVRTNKLLMVV